MQKWEYRTVTIHGSDVHWSVIGVNGDREVTMVKKGTALSGPEFLPLPSYLATVGQEGWEVVGVSSAGSNSGWALLILKRPI